MDADKETRTDESCVKSLSREEFLRQVVKKATIAGTLAASVMVVETLSLSAKAAGAQVSGV